MSGDLESVANERKPWRRSGTVYRVQMFPLKACRICSPCQASNVLHTIIGTPQSTLTTAVPRRGYSTIEAYSAQHWPLQKLLLPTAKPSGPSEFEIGSPVRKTHSISLFRDLAVFYILVQMAQIRASFGTLAAPNTLARPPRTRTKWWTVAV
jgi:hypothetical protein